MLPAKREQEMANEGLINLVAWCKRERESLQMQREMLQSGKFRIFKNEGSGQGRYIVRQYRANNGEYY
jgi:hypothetical protein